MIHYVLHNNLNLFYSIFRSSINSLNLYSNFPYYTIYHSNSITDLHLITQLVQNMNKIIHIYYHKNNIIQDYSTLLLYSSLIVLIFDKVLQPLQVDPDKNSMLQNWQLLQYYNFITKVHLYNKL